MFGVLIGIAAGGAVLAVSQFTLLGDCRKGRRPGFTDAAPPALADTLYHEYVAAHAAGYDDLVAHVRDWTPARAAEVCGIDAAVIEQVVTDRRTHGNLKMVV